MLLSAEAFSSRRDPEHTKRSSYTTRLMRSESCLERIHTDRHDCNTWHTARGRSGNRRMYCIVLTMRTGRHRDKTTTIEYGTSALYANDAIVS